jgi:hypothetical protein
VLGPKNHFTAGDAKNAFVSRSSDSLLKHLPPAFEQSYGSAYWRPRDRLLSFHATKQAGGRFMASRDVLRLCGRIGLIVAAFAFVAGIVAGPLLERLLFSQLTVTERSDPPTLPSVEVLPDQPEKQG